MFLAVLIIVFVISMIIALIIWGIAAGLGEVQDHNEYWKIASSVSAFIAFSMALIGGRG